MEVFVIEFVQPIRDLKKIETIKKLLRQQNLRDYCLFVVGINSELRISDLLKLRVLDVYENGKPKDRIRLREKKTNKFKDFPLSADAKSALKEYLKQEITKTMSLYSCQESETELRLKRLALSKT